MKCKVNSGSISLVVDHYRFTDNLVGEKLWQAVADWVWAPDDAIDNAIPRGIISNTADVRETLSDFDEIEILDYGVIITAYESPV